jgi:hypothetical protein
MTFSCHEHELLKYFSLFSDTFSNMFVSNKVVTFPEGNADHSMKDIQLCCLTLIADPSNKKHNAKSG